MSRAIGILAVSVAALSTHAAEPAGSLPPRQMEQLGRGLVAVNQGDGKAFVSELLNNGLITKCRILKYHFHNI